MARGKKCPQCGYQMYAVDEREEPRGSWVTYECRNSACRFRERVFEDKSRGWAVRSSEDYPSRQSRTV